MTEVEKPRAEGLFRELLWVHAMIRRDLRSVRRLAERVRVGAEADEVRDTIHGLQTEGPLWKLRVTCLYYCRVVHAHHTIEDVHFFPAIRRADPSLGSAVDRLEADHLKIAGHLDAVEAAAEGLGGPDDAGSRDRLAAALDDLGDHLLEHLAFEEEAIGPILNGWEDLPAE